MKLIWVILICVLGGGSAMGAGTYFYMDKKRDKQVAEKQETITRLEKENKELKGETDTATEAAASDNSSSASSDSSSSSSSSSSSNTASPASTAADATAGWQTYTNRDIGYIVKYPQGWNLAETDRWEEDHHYRYLIISSEANSANRISMHWGFVRNNTYLYSTDRTGIGAGEITEVTTNLPVLGAAVKKTKLVYEGKIKELFYAPRTTPADYTWESSVSLYDQSDYSAVDLTGVSQIDMVEAILANIQLMS